MPFCSVSQIVIQYLNWLDVLNSNERRTWGTNVENWPRVQETSNSSCYLEEEEEKLKYQHLLFQAQSLW